MADASQVNDPANGSQGNGDEPKFVTEEQLNKAINAAITGRLKDFSTSFEKKIGETLTKSLGEIAPQIDKLLDDKIAGLKPAGDGKTPQGNVPSTVDIENHPSFKGMKKQLEENAKVSQRLQEERDAERTKARDIDLRKRVSDHLSKTIPADRLQHAVGFLVDAQKRVRWNDDASELVFRDRDGDVDLETGLGAWQKSDDAKIYLPPRGPQGSGDRGGGRGTTTRQGAAGKQGNGVSFQALGESVLAAIPGMPAPR